MKKSVSLVIAILFFSLEMNAQDNMGVGTSTPDPSAVLDLDATDKGLLVPRMTTQQRTLIFQPATGLMVYDTDTDQFWYYDGSQWVQAIGPQGPQGAQGPQGPQGVAGPAGPQGAVGPTGASGVQGPTGLQGLQGLPGPQGPTGLNGADGATGPQGPQGIQGATGPAGADGAVGLQGPAGLDGADGVTGPQGPQGIQGATGPAGADGAVGAQGPAGPTGANGVAGPQGPAGPQGQVGPQGPAGAQGPVGPIGPQGLVGPTGADGAVGPAGPQGPAGLNGADGPIGPQGPQGPQGVQGLPGPAGPAGADGAQGPAGPQGPQGVPGATGPIGPTGPVNMVSGVISSAGVATSGSGFTVSNISTGSDGINFSNQFVGGTPSVVVTPSSGSTSGPANSLTTAFGGGNNFDGNMFDVIPSTNLVVNDFDVNMSVGTATVSVYYKTGTHVGSEINAGAWTLLGSSTVNAAGTGLPTNLGLNLGLALNSGQTYAFYITNQGEVDFNYTDGTAVGAVAASNGDLQILQGTGKEYPFGASFTPRVWNGTIYYGAGSQPTFSICNVSNVSTTGFQCNCVDLSGAPVDTEYHFITTGN